MNNLPSTVDPSPRLHPKLRDIFTSAEARHFTDEETAEMLQECPELKELLECATEIREKDVKIINQVVKEVYSQYPYEDHHQFATAKCPRDVRYVVSYAVHAMVANDPAWFNDKILIWLKTILQAFEFPARVAQPDSALFADEELEAKLKLLPQKTCSIFHMYYRLKQEMQKALKAEHYEMIAPYLQQAIDVLTEEY